jgi:cytochrome P450
MVASEETYLSHCLNRGERGSIQTMTVPLAIQALLFLLTTYNILRLFDESLCAARFRCFASSHGCAEPPHEKNNFPYGIDRIIRILTFKGDILEYLFYERYRKYDPTHKHHGVAGEIIHTIEPRNLQAMLSLKFEDFEVGDRRRRNLKDVVGHGIFTADGKDWERSRAALGTFFGKGGAGGLEGIEEHVGNLLQVLGRGIEEGSWTREANLLELFLRLTMDSSAEGFFGESMGSQLAGLEGERLPNSKMTIPEAYTIATAWMGFHFRLPEIAWPLTAVPFMSKRRRLDEAPRVVPRVVERCVRRALERRRQGEWQNPESDAAKSNSKGQTNGEDKAGNHRFVLLDAMAKETHNPTFLRDELLQVFFASRGTTAFLLSWCLLLLSLHPSYFQQFRASILSHFPPSKNSFITPSSLKSCKPLTYFLSETLRLYPVTPYNGRSAARDTILPTGGGPAGNEPIAVRKGQIVAYSVYALHRREDIWGADAAEFKPERWEEKTLGGRWEYLPFNGGPRICLGREC